MSGERSERVLVVLLRLSGVLLGLAVGAVFLPTEWMAAIHRWLGLGTFPASTLVEYLSRSISAIYALHGGLCLVVSMDVRRFAPVILYLGWSGFVFGVMMCFIDLQAGVPLYWTLTEGPPIAVFGLVFVVLVRRLDR